MGSAWQGVEPFRVPEHRAYAVFGSAVAALGLAVLAAALGAARGAAPGAGPILVLALLGYVLRYQALPLAEGVTFHPGTPVVLGGILLWGGWAALPLLVGSLLADARAGAPPSGILLNGGADALRMGACALVWSLASPHVIAALAAALALAAFLAADYAVTRAFLRLAPAPYDPRVLLLDAGTAPLGALGALMYLRWGAASLLLLAVPAAAILAAARRASASSREKTELERLAGENQALYEKVVEQGRSVVQMQQMVLESRKMAALGELAAGVAHEINNPLLAIQTCTELLADSLTDEDDRDSLQLVRDGIARCKSIVQQLLDFSRSTAAPREPVALDAVVEAGLALHAPTLRQAGIELTVIHDPPTARTLGPLDELAGVVSNLVANARDAVRAAAREGGRIEVRTRQTDGWAVIDVRDNGAGMSAEVRDRVFEPFFTTKPVGQGTGLGLYLVYGVVRGHEGEVEVISAPGEGACFTVRLPRCSAGQGSGR